MVLLANAKVVSGRVVETFQEPIGPSGQYRQQVIYHFENAGHTSKARQIVENADRFASLHANDVIAIRLVHLAGITFTEPDFVYQFPFEQRGKLWAAAGAFDAFWVFLLLVLWRHRRLISRGTAAAGEITKSNGRYSSRGPVRVEYVFSLPDGTLMRKCRRVNRSLFALLNGKRSINVLY